MCGVCGKYNYASQAVVEDALVERMVYTLHHRGPDGNGRHVAGPVGLGHTRLSIIDLNTGQQPISNEDDTVWIVYNGEVYNFPELRRQLISLGHTFKTATDTEVIVHLYEEYGTACLSHLRGMFAFAIWDSASKRLFCARDRVGIKPFYYVDTGSSFIFGSEIKALLVDPTVDREVSREAIDSFLTYTYLPGSDTLFRSVKKLEPGHFLVIDGNGVVDQAYWDLRFSEPAPGLSFDQASSSLRSLVDSTVADHMVSDVPVGVLLSGGIDSTAILSSAAQATSQRIKTFTIGFEGAAFDDERPYAKMAAKRYGTEHHALTISAGDFAAFLNDYVWHMEEPVCEPPAVALHYVSKLASQFVKVVLSGEGGDEAFGGYQTYRNLLLLERAKAALGRAGSKQLSLLAGTLSRWHGSPRWQKYGPLLTLPLKSYYLSRRASPFSFFPRSRAWFYSEEMQAVADAHGAERSLRSLFDRVGDQGLLNQMLYIDTKTWLPDDLLVKADKMTMANSLELRVPLLDHKVLEFAASLPPSFKVEGWGTKRVLKKAFEDRIPQPIMDRRKAGLPVPIAAWLRSDLKDYVSEVLLSERCLARGYFRSGAVETLLQRCFDGEPLAHEVFSLLTLELWHRHFVDAFPPLRPQVAKPAKASPAAAVEPAPA